MTATAPYGNIPAGPVDTVTGTILDALAEPTVDDQWDRFVRALRHAAAESQGEINQNRVRVLLDGAVPPRRVGSFYRKAVKAGLLRSVRWNLNDGTPASQLGDPRRSKNGNSGKPQRVYQWVGGALDDDD